MWGSFNIRVLTCENESVIHFVSRIEPNGHVTIRYK